MITQPSAETSCNVRLDCKVSRGVQRRVARQPLDWKDSAGIVPPVIKMYWPSVVAAVAKERRSGRGVKICQRSVTGSYVLTSAVALTCSVSPPTTTMRPAITKVELEICPRANGRLLRADHTSVSGL